MKLSRLLIPVFLFAFIIYLSCNKTENSEADKPYIPEYVTATISGRVTDDARKPVSGALVKAGTATATTDIDGAFTIKDVSIDKHAAFVKVEKNGFFLGTKTLVAAAGKNNQVAIRLIPKKPAGSITAASGGTVSVPSNGGSLTFEANSIMNPGNNTAYAGTVTVDAFFINPEASDFNEIMPGTLRGLTTNNQETGLQSFGMMAVELSGAAGEKLQLSPGKKATLHFPIPASLQGEAPATIPLWSLDESTGLWKEEGSATRQGNEYVGTVSHFSFWNCDAPFPLVDFTGIVRNQQGTNLSGVEVVITVPPGGGTAGSVTGSGFTDAEGIITGKLPANKTLQLKLYDKCHNLLHSGSIGPFSTTADLGVITVNATIVSVTFSGMVKSCSGEAVTNGVVSIKLEDVFYNAPITNGSFSTTILRCGSAAVTATLTPYDIAKQQWGSEVSVAVSGNTVDAGTMLTCGGGSDTYIKYTVDGASYQLIPPPDTVNYYPPTGTSSIYAIEGKRQGQQIEDIVIILSGPKAPGSHRVVVSDIWFGNAAIQWTRNGDINANIVEYGNAGGYITGFFSGLVRDSLNTKTSPISCSFRVKRTE